MSGIALSKPDELRAEAIRIRGLVQGVGFRPAIWRLAGECGLTGSVCNDGSGVLVQAWGRRGALERFITRLREEAPPLARIDTIDRSALSEPPPFAEFRILESGVGEVVTGVLPDAALCPACRAESRDPASRRYRYAFTNCTQCGPRFSIVRSLPYDRERTSMAGFGLCRDCRDEYSDPADRRFHAQPIACAACGPRLWLEEADGRPARTFPGKPEDALESAVQHLRAGAILAIKGIGGFHLACDATCPETLVRLRARKSRCRKPFALLARDLDMIRRYCRVDEAEARMLTSPAAPIVLLAAQGAESLPEEIAPGLDALGFMLPCTPLHDLLMERIDRPIVFTSGNLSEEPPCIDNEEARDRLRGVADAFLMHDRAIVNRVDDSVVRVSAGTERWLRRGRGAAPGTLVLPQGFEAAAPVLALGGQLKNTFCLTRDGVATLSQHIGDLEHPAAFEGYTRQIGLYAELVRHRPARLAIDAHPEYLASKWGRERARSEGLPLVEVQHHHAHLAACLVEHRWPLDGDAVLGVILDGAGWGGDGTLWGGEFLLADYRRFRRVACFKPVALPGGSRAMREPWRNAWAQIETCLGWQRFVKDFSSLEWTHYLCGRPVSALRTMLAQGLNCPMTSSAGRWFDAVAAATGICRDRIVYEGQAAMELEAVVDAALLADERETGYSFQISPDPALGFPVLGPGPMWLDLLGDLAGGASVGTIAARFHKGLARAIAAMVGQLTADGGAAAGATVVLSGGVFQNRVLLEQLMAILRTQSRRVLVPGLVPANDGGIALGQAAVAAARSLYHKD